MLQGHKTRENETAAEPCSPQSSHSLHRPLTRAGMGGISAGFSLQAAPKRPSAGAAQGTGTSEGTSCGLQVSA